MIPRSIARPLRDPLVLLLLVTGLTYSALGQREDALIAFIVLIPVVTVGLVLEGRSDRALERLRRLAAPTAHVWRDQRLTVRPAHDLLVGDTIELSAGDVVPADAVLVGVGGALTVDEALLTGETAPVIRRAGAQSRLRAGTSVVAGKASARVTGIGVQTEAGTIESLLGQRRPPVSPLERSIRRLAFWLATAAVGCCMGVVAVELGRGAGVAAALIAGVTLAMAAVPEEFPMVYTLYLSVGAWRLARQHALVRQLAGVETLGSATVICADKTGTLTTGRDSVTGAILADGVFQPPTERSVVGPILEVARLASDRHPVDPVDRAIADAAQAIGIEEHDHGAAPLFDTDFDPAQRMRVTVWPTPDGARVVAKGALEAILARGRISSAGAVSLEAANRHCASRGLRLLAIASGSVAAGVAGTPHEWSERAPLDVLGLLAFADELRPGVPESVTECRQAGIRVMLLTGDHAVTAAAVAIRLGLLAADGAVINGTTIAAADDSTLGTLVRDHSVFARVLPDQKHRIVQALRRAGEVVAMTGDGVNDAPALRDADIGVALGRHGTDVARQAATLVLLDDNFTTIVGAVRNGRRIADNLQQAFAYLIAFHVPTLLISLIVPLVGAPLVLLPVHMAWLELVVHPTSALVFEADRGAADLMRRPPRPVSRYFLRGLAPGRAVTLGAMLGAAVLVLYFRLEPVNVARARSLAFATLLIGQMALVLVVRSPEEPVWRASLRQNRLLLPIEALTLATLLGAMLIGPVQRALALTTLPASDWGIALAVGLGTTLALEPLKRGRRRDAVAATVGPAR